MKKCPYCAEEIQDEAVVCRYCGRDLSERKPGPVTVVATPVAMPMVHQPAPVKKQSRLFGLSIATVILLVCVCGACLLAPLLVDPAALGGQLITPAINTATVAQPATATRVVTVGPTRTPAPTQDLSLGLSLSEFAYHYDRLTDLQREQFLADLPGKTVDWSGTVYDVDDRGIHIDMPGSIWNGFATLRDVPPEVAITINKNGRVHFTGTIDDTVEFVFFYIYLVDVEVLDQ